MADFTFLAGKVRKRTLPVIPAPSGPHAPTEKRLLLPQGELAQFYDSDDPIRYIAFIELRTDSIRGNHYHKIKEEWIYLVQGEVLLTVEDLDAKTREQFTLAQGDLVFIAPGIAHALRIVSAGQAIEFSRSRFDGNDIYRFKLDNSSSA
jgi:mannose-6-phosphate isomerase-like protein (cupin superfamily)